MPLAREPVSRSGRASIGLNRLTVMPYRANASVQPEERSVDTSIPMTHPPSQIHTFNSTLHSIGEQLKSTRISQSTAPGVTQDQYDDDRHGSHLQLSGPVLRPPVQRLPPEVLGLIFQCCLSRSGDYLPISAQGPILLARVCRVWREIAHSDPSLWTTLCLCFPDNNREQEDLKAGVALDLWLKRSAVLPISLTLVDYRIHDASTKNLIALLADRLRKNSHRWKNLSFQLPSDYFPLLFTFAPCDLPSLESLSINGDPRGGLGIRVTSQLNLLSAPNLRSFAFSGPNRLEADIGLRWEKLKGVSFGFDSQHGIHLASAGYLAHLPQCQNVTTCSLGILRLFFASRSAERSSMITLPHLQTLRVRRLTSTSYEPFVLDLFVLPKLQVLEIDASPLVNNRRLWHSRQFSNLLARSGCSLTQLSIKDVIFTEDELLRCLALSGDLKSLHFLPDPPSQNMSDILHKLDMSRLAANLYHLPRLQELKLGFTPERGDFDEIMNLLHSRVGSRAVAARIASLRRVELVCSELWHRMERLSTFPERLVRFVSENEGAMEALLTVNSPYLPQYIDVPT